MADLGFLPAVTTLLDQTRPNGQRMLFSATLDNGVDTVVRRYLSDRSCTPRADADAGVDDGPPRVHGASRGQGRHRREIAERPGRTLFFVRTKHGADRLATQLRRSGARAGAIHGNLRQSQRQRALDAFSRGDARVLVATDVAARGIHVDDIDLVVHYPPADAKDYLHRSGRTARAGADGVVLSPPAGTGRWRGANARAGGRHGASRSDRTWSPAAARPREHDSRVGASFRTHPASITSRRGSVLRPARFAGRAACPRASRPPERSGWCGPRR